jgi:hypothetical protein
VAWLLSSVSVLVVAFVFGFFGRAFDAGCAGFGFADYGFDGDLVLIGFVFILAGSVCL